MSVVAEAFGALVPGLTAGVRTAMPYLVSLAFQGTPLSGETLEALSLGGIPKEAPVLSANEIIRQLRASGFSVQRQIALRAISLTKAQVAAHQYIQNLAFGIRPLASRVPFAVTRQTYKYHVKVLVTGRDAFTGEPTNQYVIITSTSLITKANAQALAAQVVLSGENYQMADITGVQVVTYTLQNPEREK